MSLQTVEIASHIISFDGEKTSAHRTVFDEGCDCQNCRNFYANLEAHPELMEFLSDFSMDYPLAEEVSFWNWDDKDDALIHYVANYCINGNIEEEFSVEKFGVKISFEKNSNINCDRNDDYFWLIVEGDFPYILEETREFPVAFPKNIFQKLRAVFKRKKRV